jgi:hypothetical protein
MKFQQYQTLTIQEWIKHMMLLIDRQPDGDVNKDRDIAKIRKLISLISYFDAKLRS